MSASDDNRNGLQSNQAICRKIFIQRDYSEGTMVKFQNKFPAELDGLLERDHFDYFINTLNEIYFNAEKMSSAAFCESCLACLSAYLLYLCMDTQYSKSMRKIAAFIEEQNNTIFKPRGLLVIDPIDRGLRVIEICTQIEESRNMSKPS